MRYTIAHFFNLKDREITKFKRVLADTGFTAELVRRIIREPSLAEVMLASVQEPSVYIHDVFRRAEDVLSVTLKRLVQNGFSVDRFVWIGSEAPPEYKKDKDTVVALDVTLDTLWKTFEFAYKWAADEQENGGRDLFDLSTNPDTIRLLEGSDPFQPMTLRWRRIKLNANIGKKPMDVRSPETSPGIVILLVAAQHPARLKADRSGWFVPGLECTLPTDDEPWQSVPCIQYSDYDRWVELYAYSCMSSSSIKAVPIFRR